MTRHQKEKNSIASPQKAEMLELADEDVKRTVILIFRHSWGKGG